MVSGRAFAISLLCGCAQIFGLDETTRSTPADTKLVDAAVDAPLSIDALACTGGDARATDPTTGHCYVFYMTPTTRNQARANCQTLLGPTAYLASIQTTAENQLVAGLTGASDAFLGGNDEMTEGTFRWDDGTAVVFTNWNIGEPNNAMGMFEEDCIVMLGSATLAPGKWDDRTCAPPPVNTGSYPYVCERP